MAIQNMKNYLRDQGANFDVIFHAPVYTALEVAESAHIPGDHLLKTVMVLADSKLIMVVITADCFVSLELLADELGCEKIDLATEIEIAEQFPECEIGAIPPFGHLYSIPCYADVCLEGPEFVNFCVGSHSELLHMRWESYLKFAKPKILSGIALHQGLTPPRMQYRRGRMRM